MRASEVVDIADFAREKEARFQMLEQLADYDEHLMEELLGDIEPPRDEVFGDLSARIVGRPGGAGADRLGRGATMACAGCSRRCAMKCRMSRQRRRAPA